MSTLVTPLICMALGRKKVDREWTSTLSEKLQMIGPKDLRRFAPDVHGGYVGHERLSEEDDMMQTDARLSSEMMNGHAYLVLWRNTPQSRTDMCPFCYHRHLHTSEDGHCAYHCPIWE